LAHAHAAQAELLGDVLELLAWLPPIPWRRTMTVCSGYVRPWRVPSRATEVLAASMASTRRSSRAACGDQSAIMVPVGGVLAGGSHWTAETRGTCRHREDAFDFLP
jgi:hypothetical protein